MSDLASLEDHFLRVSHDLHAHEPLWKRAPTRDEHGNMLGDFMMIIPGLNKCPHVYVQNTLRGINNVLLHYQNVVVFADFNLKINILWITFKPIPGIFLEVAAAIKVQVPQAKLVAIKRE